MRLAPLALFGMLAWAAVPVRARADVALAPIFGDHMVLQEGRPLAFWGTADPGETITIQAAGQTGKSVADRSGRWQLALPAPAPTAPAQRQPFTVTVSGKNRITLQDVVLGELWLASGQSNMEWPLVAAAGGEVDVLAANLPDLRLYQVAKPTPESLVTEPPRPLPVRGRWSRTTAQSAALFSAVGYFFGRTLLERRGRPVGIVHSSYGGSRAETWVRRSSLRAHPRLKVLVTSTPPPPTADETAAYRQKLTAWQAAQAAATTAVATNSLPEAALPQTPVSGWQPLELPRTPGAGGDQQADPHQPPRDRPVWWRRHVTLPAAFVGQPLVLRLGAIDGCDVTHVEGVRVGATCREQSQHLAWPRAYPIPARLTTGGRLTIAVRAEPGRGTGGPQGPRAAMRLALATSSAAPATSVVPAAAGADAPSIPLAGRWWWKAESAAAIVDSPAGPRPIAPAGTRTYQFPGVLWDHMIGDLTPLPLAGVIWYQGESNTKRAEQYRTLLPALIADWRAAFQQPRLPFLIVQLANYHPRWPGPGQDSNEEWAELREAQAAVAERDPASGLAVTLDIGNRDDIHPLDKRTVGHRLALAALHRVYHQPVEHAGPRYLGHRREPEGKVRIRFQHAAGLTVGGAPGDRLFGFQLAGKDRHYVAADARIEGETVVLSAPTVAAPVAVRYGWGDDPLCNLVNRAGLPAVPFRTDDWPRLTAGRQLP